LATDDIGKFSRFGCGGEDLEVRLLVLGCGRKDFEVGLLVLGSRRKDFEVGLIVLRCSGKDSEVSRVIGPRSLFTRRRDGRVCLGL
jgi:hypothetical protein